MLEMNYWAVVVAAVAAFVASSVWYILFGKALMAQRSASQGAAVDMKTAPAWKKVVELGRNLVLASVLAHLLVLSNVTGRMGAVNLGIWLWIGFPVILLSGSAIWENVPWKLAAIHAGDWLAKILLMTVILGVWR